MNTFNCSGLTSQKTQRPDIGGNIRHTNSVNYQCTVGKSRFFILLLIMSILGCPTAQSWERDLYQEGIHPNPGPIIAQKSGNYDPKDDGTYIDVLFNNLGTMQTRWHDLAKIRAHIMALQDNKIE